MFHILMKHFNIGNFSKMRWCLIILFDTFVHPSEIQSDIFKGAMWSFSLTLTHMYNVHLVTQVKVKECSIMIFLHTYMCTSVIIQTHIYMYMCLSPSSIQCDTNTHLYNVQWFCYTEFSICSPNIAACGRQQFWPCFPASKIFCTVLPTVQCYPHNIVSPHPKYFCTILLTVQCAMLTILFPPHPKYFCTLFQYSASVQVFEHCIVDTVQCAV